MKPTVGRIVLVRSPAFQGECPAIVTAVFAGGESINVRVFTNEHDACPLISFLQKQDESSLSWGWRWPPQSIPPKVMRDLTPQEIEAVNALEGRGKLTLTHVRTLEELTSGESDAGGISGPEAA